MAIKQRIIEKLDNIYKNIDEESGEISQRFHLIVDDLGEAQQLCEKGLPEKSYVKYDEYYSSLVMAFEQILSGLDSGEVKEIIGLSREILQHIMAATTNEENFKKEVVFLPYKYSMWDSLESVWQAANEDKDHTLAYVMPIPYADRNPDGSAAQWHCERDEFPSNVPTIDWREVDLKEWHPDVIFFHNPYDEYNKVTSVDPTYYSSKLKQYTDKLVYIPYYVLHEPSLPFDDPTKKDEVIEEEEKIAHYITVPGVLNADITVVQSEDMRRVYLDVLERHTNAGRDYWETRISGLGSPKFDKVTNSRREDYELPKKWQKLINGRKTVLYNTGLSAMLEHTDKYLIKLRSVLETFKAQKDVVLWWRPHPLLRATFQSMHPELLKEYDKIVKKYKQEGWGIYDDTAELDRAVVWTDGYYGDWSSVVWLYEKTNKIVLIQKFTKEDAPLREFNGNTHFMDVAYNGGYIYFSESGFNGLFRYKEGKTEAEFLGRFPEEELWQMDLHRRVFVRGDKLYFIPMNGHGISVYDCMSKEFEMLKIPDTDDEYARYMQCIDIGNKILLIPTNLCAPLAIFDIEKCAIKSIENFGKQVAALVPQPALYEMFSVHCSVYKKNIVYLAVSSTNIILKVSLDDFQVTRHVLPVQINLRCINYCKDRFYFTAKEHVMGEWLEETNTCQLHNIPHEISDENYPYLQVVPYGDDVFLISGREDIFWRFNTRTHKWTNLTDRIPSEFERDIQGSLLFLGFKQDKNNLSLYPRSGNGTLLFNCKNECFSFVNIKYSRNVSLNLRKKLVHQILSENSAQIYKDGILLEDMLVFISSIDEQFVEEKYTEFVGEKIYSLFVTPMM